jgi:hypothetical protein
VVLVVGPGNAPLVAVLKSAVACFAIGWSATGQRSNLFLCIIVTMSDDAARFRKQAEECREQAVKSVSPLDKEAWLRTAEEWLKLAASVDDRSRG